MSTEYERTWADATLSQSCKDNCYVLIDPILFFLLSADAQACDVAMPQCMPAWK